MSEQINETELLDRLEHVKETLQSAEFNSVNNDNIVFLNLDSFYKYIDELNGSDGFYSFSDIMESIKPYIPLAISEDELGQYLSAAVANDFAELRRLELAFINLSAVKFINAAYQADMDEWRDLVEACKTIRACKEQNTSEQSYAEQSYIFL